MARRYYTLDEVNGLIPSLEASWAQIMVLRTQLKVVYRRLDAAGFAPSDDDFTPAVPGAPPEVVRDRAAFRSLVDLLRSELAAVAAKGCMIKDIETGLCDWYARQGSVDVLLCWRYGEKEVAFFHDLESGFAGRRPVSELLPPDPPARTIH